MADEVERVTMLQRSPSYIFSLEMRDSVTRIIQIFFLARLASSINRLRSVISGYFTVFCCFFPHYVRCRLRYVTVQQLPSHVKWDPHFNPRYNPWEQRLCASPNGDFYAAIPSGKASVVTGVIKNITRNEIPLESGETLRPDTIVTATGLKLRFAGGIQLSVDGGPLVDVTKKFT